MMGKQEIQEYGARFLGTSVPGGTRHGVMDSFAMMIRGATLLAVGVFVVGAIFGSISLSSGDPLYSSFGTLEDLTGQAFEIAPIVLIVIVAVLILSFVRDL